MHFLLRPGLKPPSEWTADMAAAVSKFEAVKKNAVTGDGKTDTVLKLWFWNKNQAIELDYKSYGLMTPEPGRERPRGADVHLPAGHADQDR